MHGERRAPCGAQVTAPQLALLEGVMARMERVDVWILMNGGGGGVNPFQARAEPCRAWARPGRGACARASVLAQAPLRFRGSAHVEAPPGRGGRRAWCTAGALVRGLARRAAGEAVLLDG